jgi:hypothetical protein
MDIGTVLRQYVAVVISGNFKLDIHTIIELETVTVEVFVAVTRDPGPVNSSDAADKSFTLAINAAAGHSVKRRQRCRRVGV